MTRSRLTPTQITLALVLVMVLGWAPGHLGGQTDALSGRWAAPEQDRGVTVSLTLDAAGRLVIPGTGPGGRVAALSLAIRDIRRDAESATFIVDLPDKEGTLEFEVRRGRTGEVVVLRVLRVDGEPAEDLFPPWTLARQR